jgi:hypothetical protein
MIQDRLSERPREALVHRAGETITDGRLRVAAPYGDVIHNWPCAARKTQAMLRAGGARRLTRKLCRCPTGAKKNSLEKCLVHLGRETQWALRPR